jgi:hypothetical protein
VGANLNTVVIYSGILTLENIVTAVNYLSTFITSAAAAVGRNSQLIFSDILPVPPTSIEIVGHRSGSRIDVREHEELELKCKVSNSKPKATIVWYRKDSRYVTGNQAWANEVL